MRADTSTLSSAPAGIERWPCEPSTRPAATSAKRTVMGASSVRGGSEPGSASIDSSHTRAKSSASAGNAGTP